MQSSPPHDDEIRAIVTPIPFVKFGGVTIYHGDALDIMPELRDMDKQTIDLFQN